MKSLLTLSLLLLYLVPLFAQDSVRVYRLDEITVKDNRYFFSYPAAPLAAQEFSSEELKLEADAPFLTKLSRMTPGMFVTQRSTLGYGIGAGSAGGITIRGIGSAPNTQVLVLMDGTPQYMGLMGHPLSDIFNEHNVSDVQVIKGPASALYGSNAMGGVINIVTRRPDREGLLFSLDVGVADFNTHKFSAGADYKQGPLDLSANFRKESTDGHRPYSNYFSDGFSLNAHHQTTEHIGLSFAGTVDKFRVWDPGPEANPFIDNWADVTRANGVLSLENKYETTDGQASLYYNYGDHAIYDGFRSNDFNIGLRAFQTFRFPTGTSVTGGIDIKHYGGEAENILRNVNFGEHTVTETGAFVNVNQVLAATVSLNAALRVENSSVFGATIAPQGGITWAPTTMLRVKALVSRGYRNPTIRELHLFPFPTPDLEPEEAWNYEAGFELFLTQGLMLTTDIYYIEGENMIQVTGAPPNLTYANTGTFNNKGFESRLTWSPLHELTVTAGYSYIDPDRITMGFAQNRLLAGATWRHEMIDLILSMENNSKIYGGNNFRNQLSDYTLVNFKARVKAVSSFVITASVENLLDEEYQVIAGYPMPGRLAELGVRYQFHIDP